MNLSPILIIAYNRYEKITQILNILKNVKNLSSVYFKIDGPRNKQDFLKIKIVIIQIKNFKKFTNKKIFIKTEKYNLGLKNNIISGINWVFSKEDKLIILEDDNIFDISFLSFSTKILKLYEKNENIFHINGTNFNTSKVSNDYYFSKLADCVGWATWKRAWIKLEKSFDLNSLMDSYKFNNYYKDKEITNWFCEYLFREINTKRKRGLWSTWWQLSIINNNGICINPSKNLVFHDGYEKKDNPEHFNKLALIKKNYSIENIKINKLIKKKINYNYTDDNPHINLIKNIDPFFNIVNKMKWSIKKYFRKSIYSKKFSYVKL